MFLLISALMVLSFRQGCGRKLLESSEYEDSTALVKGESDKSRVMVELMDYKDPGPNTNPKSGYPFDPAPPHG